jgi:hypothetical protein
MPGTIECIGPRDTRKAGPRTGSLHIPSQDRTSLKYSTGSADMSNEASSSVSAVCVEGTKG